MSKLLTQRAQHNNNTPSQGSVSPQGRRPSHTNYNALPPKSSTGGTQRPRAADPAHRSMPSLPAGGTQGLLAARQPPCGGGITPADSLLAPRHIGAHLHAQVHLVVPHLCYEKAEPPIMSPSRQYEHARAVACTQPVCNLHRAPMGWDASCGDFRLPTCSQKHLCLKFARAGQSPRLLADPSCSAATRAWGLCAKCCAIGRAESWRARLLARSGPFRAACSCRRSSLPRWHSSRWTLRWR